MTDADLNEDHPKYVVFHFEDWRDFMDAVDEYRERLHPDHDNVPTQSLVQKLDDAVVIRLKDPFAATALFTYCNTIMSFIELMESNDSISEDEHTRMLDIADYFHQQACESQSIKNKRLPD